MPVKNSILPVPYGAVASSALTANTYTAVNPTGLGEACFLLRVNNFTSQIIIVSYDGVTDHDQIDTRTSLQIYGGQGSSSPNSSHALWPANTVVWVRSAAGTGAVTVTGYYQPQT